VEEKLPIGLFEKQPRKWQNAYGENKMKINDKVIVAFLVSAGVFSVVQAAQYVGSLSAKERASLFSVAKASDNNVVICENPIFETGEPSSKGA
jgi:hypothetical protein